MYSFQELFAIIIKLMGFPDDSIVTGYLQRFNDIGILINISILVVTAVWFAYFAILLELSIVAVFMCGLLVASMPAITIIVTSWYAPNFTIGILLIPPALTILYAVKTGNFHLRSFFIALVVIGFCFSNLLFTTVIPFTIVLSISVSSHDKLNSLISTHTEHFRVKTLLVRLLHFAFIVDIFVAIFYYPVLFVLFRKHFIIISVVILLLSLTTLLLLYYLKARKQLVANLIKYVTTPLLTGWALGANFFIPYWGISASKAFQFKGINRTQLTFIGTLKNIDIFHFFEQLWWNWIILLLLSYGIFLGIKLLSKQTRADRTTVFVQSIITLTLVLNILIAMNVTMVGNNFISGNEVRFYIPILFVIPIFIHYLFKNKPTGYKLVICLFFSLALLSYYDYVKYISVYNAEVKTQYIKAENIMNQHLAKYSNANIICKNTAVPERCAILAAFHNYRTPKSLEKLKLNELNKHRIISFYHPDESVTEAEFEKFIKSNNLTKPILVLPEFYVIN